MLGSGIWSQLQGGHVRQWREAESPKWVEKPLGHVLDGLITACQDRQSVGIPSARTRVWSLANSSCVGSTGEFVESSEVSPDSVTWTTMN